ncbi:uncharacterized protein LOC141613790 [Silene latifolia]|uniref:uncharacterized protein LOC141613790 n=1 Tax=Silene latifolia TaxID=37657 RepID=UPI003D76EA65
MEVDDDDTSEEVGDDDDDGSDGTKKTALADKPKSTDMPTTSTSQQLDEGTKKTDKPKSPPVLPATTTSSLKEQVDEAGGSSTKSKTHSFSDLKIRSLNSTQYKGKDYMQKVRTVTMKRLHEEAGHRIATEQLIVIPLEEDILGAERQAHLSWDVLALWAGLDQIDIQHIFVWMK